jgi:hypothetical protein
VKGYEVKSNDSEFIEADNFYIVFDALEVSLLSFDHVAGWVIVTYGFSSVESVR